MKKLLVISLAALLVVAFCLPASAFESQFGGYWRTRMVIRNDFDGDGTGAQDIQKVDTRTRIYYTAILNENLKFVNKFEFDTAWGKNNGAGNVAGLNRYGDYGADDQSVEIKESYVNFTVAPLNATIGIHNPYLGRGFIWDDEGAGITVKFQNEMMTLPFSWWRGYEGGDARNRNDLDNLALYPTFNVAESFSISPYVVWMTSKDASAAIAAGNASSTGLPAGAEKVSVWWAGLDLNGSVGPASLWFTGIYQGGSVDDVPVAVGTDDFDVKAFVLAGGGSVPLGPVSIHTQAFYASGDDDSTDNDLEAFFGIGGGGAGRAYYWAEILGLGRFDWDFPTNSPQADVSNIWAVNLGASIKPFDKLTITGDVWYAQLVEDVLFANGNKEDELGWEFDLVFTYQLVEGMNVDLVGAYLFAGDAVSNDGDNNEDPWEVGSRFSISF